MLTPNVVRRPSRVLQFCFVLHGAALLVALRSVPDARAADPPPGLSGAPGFDFDGDGESDLLITEVIESPDDPTIRQIQVFTSSTSDAGYVLSRGEADDLYGASVSTAGDINFDGFDDIVVGAPGSNLGGVRGGMAYIHSGFDGELIGAFLGRPGTSTGRSVSGVGDFNGDGWDDVGVGSFVVRDDGLHAGIVTVFSGFDQQVVGRVVGGFDHNGADLFGHAIAGLGDLDGDGFAEIAVSSPFDAIDGSTAHGRVFVFAGLPSENGLIDQIAADAIATFTNEDDRIEHFGLVVGPALDMNADGLNEVLVFSGRIEPDGTRRIRIDAFDTLTGQLVSTVTVDPISHPGDTDLDNDVDTDDLNTVLAGIGDQVPSGRPYSGDTTGDGEVDTEDLLDVVEQYGIDSVLLEYTDQPNLFILARTRLHEILRDEIANGGDGGPLGGGDPPVPDPQLLGCKPPDAPPDCFGGVPAPDDNPTPPGFFAPPIRPIFIAGPYIPPPPPPFCDEPSPCECDELPFHECYCDDDGDGVLNFWEDDDCDGVPNIVDGSTAAGGCYLLGATCLAIDPPTGRPRYELACSTCYRRPAVDLRIDSNNDGVIDCEDDEVEDEAPGRIVMLNHDDDNNDGRLDFFSDGPLEDAEGVPVEDDELVEIRVRAPGVVESWSIVFPELVEGTTTRILRVYRKGDRTEEVASGAVYDEDPPVMLYVEGGKPSAVQGDVQVSFFVTWKSGVDANGEDEFCEHSDTVTLTVASVRFTDIRGLFNEEGEYEEGYAGLDDAGRVYSNRVYDQDDPSETIWTKDRQFMDLFVEVLPDDLILPDSARIEWAWTDPDDSSDDPPMQDSARELIDPNDDDGNDDDGDGLDEDGLDNTGERDDRSVWEQIDENHVMEGQNRTAIVDRMSSVRFNVTDDGGDNFIVRPGLVLPEAGGGRAEARTGNITTWKLIHLETVKMPSGQALPYDGLNAHFERAFVEWRPREPRMVPDQNPMGPNENAAYLAVGNYVKAPPVGHFQNAGQGGWFFMASAGSFAPSSAPDQGPVVVVDYSQDGASTVVQGGFGNYGGKIRLPDELEDGEDVSYIKIFNADGSKDIAFSAVRHENDPDDIIRIKTPPNYHPQEDNPNSNDYLDLIDHGFAIGSEIDLIAYDEVSFITVGISPGVWLGIDLYFQGRTIIFVENADPLTTMAHELTHGLGMAHMCGSMDYMNSQACVMQYDHFWLQNAAGNLIPWSDGNTGRNLCAPHIRFIRQANLEEDGDNSQSPGWRSLGW